MAPGFKTGGRKKGSVNRATAEAAKNAAKTGELPRDYMLRIMRDPTITHDRRDDMAKAVAPYLHPKLVATEISGNEDKPLVHKLKIQFVAPDE